MVVVSASVGGGKGRDAKRAKALAVKKQQMEARIQEKVESWFQKFDADGNNALDKEELRSLLTHLHPEKLADDAALENLMLMAGGASSIIPHGQQSISKEQCMKVRPRQLTDLRPPQAGRAPHTRLRSRRRPYKSTTATSRTGYSSTNSSASSIKTVRRKTFPDSLLACRALTRGAEVCPDHGSTDRTLVRSRAGSGTLEQSELLTVLEAFAPNDVAPTQGAARLHLPPPHPHAASRATPTARRRVPPPPPEPTDSPPYPSPLLPHAPTHPRTHVVFGASHPPAAPTSVSHPSTLALAADVDFVLSHCDTDGDGSINRNELLPMLAEWKVPLRPHWP